MGATKNSPTGGGGATAEGSFECAKRQRSPCLHFPFCHAKQTPTGRGSAAAGAADDDNKPEDPRLES